MKPVFATERHSLERIVGRPLPSFLFTSRNRVIFDGQTLFTLSTRAGDEPRVATDRMARLDGYQSQPLRDPSPLPEATPSWEKRAGDWFTIYDEEHARAKWEQCLQANRDTLRTLVDEATSFIRRQASRFKGRRKVVSFSGGKDSSVTADLVAKALGPMPLLFGDTTIEFPETIEYVQRFAARYGAELFQEKPDADFRSLCDVLGPPSRLMRWCCTVCKSRPINRYYERLSTDALSFDGIRRMESVRRAAYPRVVQLQKLSRQVAARPILHWSSFAVWLYIFSEGIEYNPLYEYGYSRVGCVHCPSNTPFNEHLTRTNFPELYEPWVRYLVQYAARSGKADPESYVRSGHWKSRNIKKHRSVVVEPDQPCGSTENVVYTFDSPITAELVQFLKPFGALSPLACPGAEGFAIGRGNPLLITGTVGQDQLVVALERKGSRLLRMQIEKQIEKYLNCVHCGGCAGVCTRGAIEIRDGQYHIDDDRCTRCGRCVTTNYLKQGCVALNFGSSKKSVRR